MSSSSQARKPHWRKRLATTLFIWFMALALGPVLVIGVLEYREGKKVIIDDHYEQLSIKNLLLSEQLNDFFDSMVTSLFIKSWSAQEFVDKLSESFGKVGGTATEYIKTSEYQSIVERYAEEFVSFAANNGYANVIIGDSQGNILYTVHESLKLGKNLFLGSLSRTEFSKSVKKSVSNYKPAFTALENYLEEGAEPVSFFIMPLINDDEIVAGFIAIQIFADSIQKLFLRQGEILGNTTSSYLINTDGQIIFGTHYEPELKLMLDPGNTLLKLWLSHVDPVTGNYSEEDSHITSEDESFSGSNHEEHDKEEEILEQHKSKLTKIYSHIKNYKDLSKREVMGIYYPVNVGGTPMAMISEVPHALAFRSLYDFQKRLLWTSASILIIVILLAMVITRRLVKPINTITSWVKRVSSGDYVQGHVMSGNTEITELSKNFIDMTERLRTISAENEQRSWMQGGLAGLNDSLRGEVAMSDMCCNVVTYLCRYLGFQTGGMYVLVDDQTLHLMGSFAWHNSKQHPNKFKVGEGVVGQAALEKKTIEMADIPEDYLVIESGLVRALPVCILVMPFVYEDEAKGVFEFGLLRPPSEQQLEFMQHSIENVGIAINSAQYRSRVNHLLDKTTKQSEVLKEQQEELKSVNEELEKRATILEASEEELKAQSEELQKSNAELEEKSEQLFQQKEQIEQKNRDIELSKKEVEEKAKQVEQSSKYKSEFLANMSHELRTPLNALLLLSQMLADNDEGNLTEDQIESAKVIYNGSNDLLELINDILDLSKVEAGKMAVTLEPIDLQELCMGISKLFQPLAENKGLEFEVSVLPGATKVILSDSQRLLQVIKNFLSNAFKFTESGGVYVTAKRVVREGRHSHNSYISFSIRDTGIGIPKEKQAAIFEAFQQAEGSTSRKYGGTGLGLAISKEFASLLGGFIEIESEENKGTIFSILLPDNPVCSLSSDHIEADSYAPEVVQEQPENAVKKAEEQTVKSLPKDESVVDNKEKDMHPLPEIKPGQSSVLLIEDDPRFIDVLGRIAEKHHFQYFHSDQGKVGISLAEKVQPDAIILDLGLPDMDGHDVLATLKKNPATKDIPVHIVSGRDPDEIKTEGVVGFLVKPVSIDELDKVFVTLAGAISHDIQQVLVFDEDEGVRKNIGNMLAKKGIEWGEVSDITAAEKMLQTGQWECLVMDYEFEDGSGIEFLHKVQKQLGKNMPSVVIHTARDITESEYKELQQFTSTMVMKGDNASSRVTDEVSLFLHSLKKPSEPVQERKEMDVDSEDADKTLENRKLLLVDDDLRNTFALSKALQGMGMEIVIADNGKVALEKLESEDDIELVLMDIMMPIMDGYETMEEIRKNSVYTDLPVIALTAKAMKEDRIKCIDAGANDYMTKPVDMDKLVAMLKVWLLK